MPSITNIPPFPSDVPKADITVIDAEKLAAGDPDATREVYDAATGYGFFYLSNHHVDPDIPFRIANNVFELPLDEKLKYDMGTTHQYSGYKRSGATGVDKDGTTDHIEFYNIGKDDVLGVNGGEWKGHPEEVMDRRSDLQRFMRSCHALVASVVRALGKELGVEEGVLEDMHRLEGPSMCQARVTHAPPIEGETVTLGPHTDFGSVTVLFNQVGGLQVLRPGAREWQYVHPQPEYAIINLGDAFVKLCGGKLYSALHRVVSPPGEQSRCERHSVVYFCRPCNGVLLRSLFATAGEEDEEEVMTADQWVAMRAKGVLKANYKGADSLKALRGTAHT